MCLNFSLILIIKVLDFILCDKEEEEEESQLGSSVSLISCISPSSSYSKPSSPPYHKPGSYFSPPPPIQLYPKPAASSFISPSPRLLPSYPKPASSSSRSSYSSSSKILPSVPLSSPPPPPLSYPKPTSSFSLPPPPSPSSPKPAASSLISPPTRSPSSYPKPALSSSRSYSSSTKPTLFPAPPSSSKNQQNLTNYIRVDKGTPIYIIPEKIKHLLEKDIVPDILKKPLSPSTYKDYFDTLLYAEDYYLEKWDGFELKSVALELHKASINYSRKGKFKNINANDEKDDKIFVAFEIDKIPVRLPFLLSRDFASARPSGSKVEPFQGIIYRVLRSRLVLVEFGEDFHSQHYLGCKYDVKFSFNRVCLKRAHQAIAAASDSLLQNFIFPDSCIPRNTLTTSRPLSIIDHKVLNMKQVSIVHEMLRLHGPPPYLVEGPISVIKSKVLSRTGIAVKEAVLQIYRTFPVCRILICAPINSTCDVIMRSLRKEIPESSMFRANAAFRELDGVPLDILPSCVYKGECFSCPSLQELQEFKVILSTFMSSVRLQNVGIMAGHFSHIFLVDASSATEPETMVALANLANETTSVVITGAPRNRSGWIRSSIARQNGLMTSYFERLTESKLYSTLDPRFITQLED